MLSVKPAGSAGVFRVPLEEAEACSGREVRSAVLGFFGAPFALEHNSVRVEGFAAEEHEGTGEAQLMVQILDNGKEIGDPMPVKVTDVVDGMEKAKTRRWKCMRAESDGQSEESQETSGEGEGETAQGGARILLGFSGGGEGFADDGVDAVPIRHYPYVRRALQLAGVVRGDTDEASVAELQEAVSNMAGVMCSNKAQIVFELEKAETALCNDKGSPQMRRFRGALRMGALSGADDTRRGQLIRQLVLPEVQPRARQDTSPSQRRQHGAEGEDSAELYPLGGRTKGGKVAGAKRGRREQSDSDSGSDSDSDSDSIARSESARRTSEKQPKLSKKRSVKGELHELSAPGMSELDVAAIVFDGGRACEIAQVEPFNDTSHMAAARRSARYAKAFGRLCDEVGCDWIGESPAADAAEVEERVEEMLDGVARRNKPWRPDRRVDDDDGRRRGRGADDKERNRRDRSRSPGRDSEEDETKSRAAKALSVEQESSAVSADVAQRLHDYRTDVKALATAHPDDPAAFISNAPSRLREDLRRVGHSNDMVSCEGERNESRKGLPAGVLKFGRAVRLRLQDTLMEVALDDTTGGHQLPVGTADKLARLLRTGKLDFDEFAKAAGEMTGEGFKGCTSMDAIQESWALMKPGLETLAKVLVWPELEQGVRLLNKKLTTTARHTLKTPSMLMAWAKKVATAYTRELSRFRAFDAGRPSLEDAITSQETLYAHDTALAAMRKEFGSRLVKPREADPDRRLGGRPGKHGDRKLERTRPGGKEEEPRADGKFESAGVKRAMGSKDDWAKLCEKVKTELPETCGHWLLTKCSFGGGKCRKEHKRSAKVNAFVAKTDGLSWA